MPATNALLDKVRESCSIPSDNALSQRLGVTRAVVSMWRSGGKPMPDERIAQACALAKLDGGEWLARIHTERAASPAEKALWRSVLDRLSAAAAVVALTACMMPATNRDNSLSIQKVTTGQCAYSVYYVRLVAWLRRRFTPRRPGWPAEWSSANA